MADQPETQTAEPEAKTEAPGAEVVQGWKGFRLDELGGGSVARVEGALVDGETGEPAWLLVRLGRFGHHSAVPVAHAVAGVGHIWVPYTRDQIRGTPRVDPGKGLTAEGELAFYAHYGFPTDRDRPAKLAGRDPAGISARPAG
jgi:hypothetical protein